MILTGFPSTLLLLLLLLLLFLLPLIFFLLLLLLLLLSIFQNFWVSCFVGTDWTNQVKASFHRLVMWLVYVMMSDSWRTVWQRKDSNPPSDVLWHSNRRFEEEEEVLLWYEDTDLLPASLPHAESLITSSVFHFQDKINVSGSEHRVTLWSRNVARKCLNANVSCCLA